MIGHEKLLLLKKKRGEGENFMKAKYIVAILLMCLAVTFLGSFALAQPPGYEEEKEFGAWSNEHWGTIVTGAEAQMVTYLNHDVDAGGPPTPDDIPTLIAAGYMMSSTGGFSHYWYALNNRVEPLDDPVFRTALAYCMDKETIYPTLYGPLVTPIFNWAPPAQAFWCNPAVDDAFPRFNLQTAIDTLVGGGYTPVLIDGGGVAEPGNIDHWHMPGTTTNIRDLEQGVPVTSTLGMQVSAWIETDLHSIGLPIYHTPLPFNYIVYQQWLAPPYLNWDMTIGIGLVFGVDPVMDTMYHSDAIPFANIWGLQNQQVDDYIDAAMQTLNWDEAQTNIWACQELLSEIMPLIPMITSQTWTMATGPYDGRPGVLGWVNMVGYGGISTSNDWNRMYSRRAELDESIVPVADWIMGTDAGVLNPLVSDTTYEYRIMGTALQGLYSRHPYTHELMPWCIVDKPLIELWDGTYTADIDDPDFTDPTYDPSPVGSPGAVIGEKMTFELRSDMTWHDETPVTAADCEFMLDLCVNQNNERYDAIHKWIHDVNVVSTYVFEVYFTARYLWADNDIAGISLLTPKHIWEPYINGPDNILWNGDDEDHRFWDGTNWINNYGYEAPEIETPSGTVQLTHFQGNGYNVFPAGGWTPGVSFHLVRWHGSGFHYNRILRGDNNFDGISDVLDLWAPLYAMGTQPGMPRWRFEADMANPAALIDGRDVEVVYNDWGYYWYPYSTLP